MTNIRRLLLLLTFLLLCGCTLNDLESSTAQSTPFSSTAPSATSNPAGSESSIPESTSHDTQISVDGVYSTPEAVAAYIHLYKQLPSNYITKKEAIALGWESSKGNLWKVTDQLSIGGDTFGNREGKLPSEKGRKWYECDVNYEGGYRTSERIVYSNDGLIYYTNDHYETFTQLY